jgi:hypothetical protein
MIASMGSSNICFTDASQLAPHGFKRLARLAPRLDSLVRVYQIPLAHGFVVSNRSSSGTKNSISFK